MVGGRRSRPAVAGRDREAALRFIDALLAELPEGVEEQDLLLRKAGHEEALGRAEASTQTLQTAAVEEEVERRQAVAERFVDLPIEARQQLHENCPAPIAACAGELVVGLLEPNLRDANRAVERYIEDHLL